jgi:hypothetical protein
MDFMHRIRAMLGGDLEKLLTVRVAAVEFVKTTGRVARSTDNRSAREHVVN